LPRKTVSDGTNPPMVEVSFHDHYICTKWPFFPAGSLSLDRSGAPNIRFPFPLGKEIRWHLTPA
jgi:hypothetical protein